MGKDKAALAAEGSGAREARTGPGILQEFERWMCEHRGLAFSTLIRYRSVLRRMPEVAEDRVESLSAAGIRAFVLDYCRRWPRDAGHARTAVRMFLRYLASTSRIDAALIDAVPLIAGWRRASLPRFLSGIEVARLVASCDAHTRAGARDRALLLLLSRLGLRAGDVSSLRLSQLDFGSGELVVRGKSRRSERLPLPQDVGDAILCWLRHRRGDGGRVFEGLRRPFAPLGGHAIADIVERAMHRAGVEAATHGAHLLRHSLATDLLRRGASLPEIGAILRHRSVETTAIYAKVDFAHLALVAQAWPEVAPC